HSKTYQSFTPAGADRALPRRYATASARIRLAASSRCLSASSFANGGASRSSVSGGSLPAPAASSPFFTSVASLPSGPFLPLSFFGASPPFSSPPPFLLSLSFGGSLSSLFSSPEGGSSLPSGGGGA